MYRGRGGRFGRRGGRGDSSGSTALKGLFVDGVWRCNCQPRLPAAHFQTKNGGKNHGRWFWTCQQPQLKRCGFFLWDDDAKPREEAAVLSNSRSEPQAAAAAAPPTAPTTPSRPRVQRDDTAEPDEPPPPYTPFETPRKTGSERKAQNGAYSEDEEFYDWPLTGQEENEVLDHAARTPACATQSRYTDALRSTPAIPPETPRKTPRTDVLTSPGKRKRDAAGDGPHLGFEPLPTPQTGTRHRDIDTSEDPFTTPSKTPSSLSRTGLTDATQKFNLLSPTASPTRQPLSQINLDATSTEYQLGQDVFSILGSHKVEVDDKTRASLTEVLNRHALRTQGIMKGRDITRVAVKQKDVKIAELQYRIASLEAERETDRAVIRGLRSQLASQQGPSRSQTADS